MWQRRDGGKHKRLWPGWRDPVCCCAALAAVLLWPACLPADGEPAGPLPSGSHTLGRSESFYQIHRSLILATVAGLCGLSLLVLILTRSLLRVRRAESALRRSEGRYRTLFETMAQGVVYQSGDGRITSVNQAALRILGLTRDQIEGRTSLDPRWRAIREEGTEFPGEQHPSMECLRSGREVGPLVMGIFNPVSEDYRWIKVHAVPRCEPGEERPVEVFTSFEDISEQKAAVDALRDSEQRLEHLAALYHALGDANQAMVRLTDESRLCEQVCAIVRRLGGYRLVWIGRCDAGRNRLHAMAVATGDQPSASSAGTGLPPDAARAGPEPGSGLLAEDCLRSGAIRLRPVEGESGGSAACFPLFRDGETVGVLEIQSAATGDFDSAVMQLLEELAADISYAFDNLERARALRETLEQLSRSEEQYRLIVETSNEGVWLIDADHHTRFVNPRMAQMLGYSVEEMMGTRSDDYLHPDERESYSRQLAQRHQLDAGCYESRLLRRDGTPVWVQVSAVPLLDGQGAFSGSFGMVSDISARKQAEIELERYRLGLEETVAARTAELRATESHLRLILESSASGLFGIDTEGRLSFVNPAACRMLGYSADALLGVPCHATFHARHADGSHYPSTDCPIHTALTQGCEVSVDDDVFWRADGRPLPVIYSAHPMHSEGRIVGAVVGFLDLSERKRVEARLQEAREEAERLSQVKSVFLANMSHEIRTPMNAILGMTYLVQRDIRDPIQRDRLDKMTGAAHHLLAIINDILDFSQIEAGKLVLDRVEFGLRGMLERACSLVDEQARAKGLTLVTRLDVLLAAVPRAVGDPARLTQVLLNFLGNAVKFTERGQISLSGSVESESADDWLLRFEVEDTGIGIGDEDQPRLFEAFGQADDSMTRRHGGAGLGLAINRRLAELMCGGVGVESRPGVGSRFWVKVRLGKARSPTGDMPDRLDGGDLPTARLLPSDEAPSSTGLLAPRRGGDRISADAVLARLDTLLRADDALATRLVREHAELLCATCGAPAQDLARQVESFDYEGALVTLAAMRDAVGSPRPSLASDDHPTPLTHLGPGYAG